MTKLLMLKGLPASGKSTYAKELVEKQDYYRVNKDDLRAMVHSGRWGKEREKFILHWRDTIVKDSLGGLKNVVVDDTNFAPKHEITLRAIAEVYGAKFEVKFFDTPIEECIKRDLARPNSVGEKVIKQMYNQYLRPKSEPPVWDTALKSAVICDIDGTLAIMKNRGPFEWAKVGNDDIDRAVSMLLHDISDHTIRQTIILLSGRDSICRPETEAWLKKHNVLYDELHMRPEGDMRKDNIVKRELYDQHIAGKYNVLFVLDDRDQVVDMWRNELGLKVFQVAEGDF